MIETALCTCLDQQPGFEPCPEHGDGNLRGLREYYARDFITIEELEIGLESVLRGGPINVPRAKK